MRRSLPIALRTEWLAFSGAFALASLISAAGCDRCGSPDPTGGHIAALEEEFDTEVRLPRPPESEWTSFSRHADTRVVYVSSSTGDDANDGLTETTPKKTIAAASELVRHGFPDWLLLRRGDTFYEPIGQWKKSGRSAEAPMLIGTFGEGPRPRLASGNRTAFETSGAGGAPATIDFIALVGLHLHAHAYDGQARISGISLLRGGQHWLIEDCKIEGYYTNLVIQGVDGPHRFVTLRRNVIVDAYKLGKEGHSQGMYMANAEDVLIEENVFDHNGFHRDLKEAAPNIYRHNIYIDNGNKGVIVRDNIVTNGASHGIQLRSGGIVENNVFARNSIQVLVGGGDEPEPGGVLAEVRRNAVLEGKNIDAENPRGWGIEGENLRAGDITENILAGRGPGKMPRAINVSESPSKASQIRIAHNVVYDYGGGVVIEGPGSVVLHHNLVRDHDSDAPLLVLSGPSLTLLSADNRFDSGAAKDKWVEMGEHAVSLEAFNRRMNDESTRAAIVAVKAPNADLASYHGSLGREASFDAFILEAREQGRHNWRKEYTAKAVYAYLRDAYSAK